MKKIGILFATAALAASHSSSAAVIAAWDLATTPSSATNPTPPATTSASNVTVSNLSLHGSVAATSSGNPTVYTGLTTTINLNNYVGFTVTPNAGYELTLTDLSYVQPASTVSTAGQSYSWGYRIDGGTWNVFSGEVAYGSVALKNFVFTNPVTTTKSVEFGFFGSAVSTTSEVALTINAGNRNDIQLNGSVAAAVPEPSSILMGGLAGMGLMLRRRRKN